MDRAKLIEYIEFLKSGDLIYQFPEELLCVLGEPSDEQMSIHDEKNMLIKIIQKAKHVKQVDKDFLEELKGYSDLAQWSHEEDALVLVDEDLLINLGSLPEMKASLEIKEGKQELIGLVDADLLNGGTRHPNLALLKLAGFLYDNEISFRLITDTNQNVDKYTRMYISKVFSFTPNPKFYDKVKGTQEEKKFYLGGTGDYAIKRDVKDFKSARLRDMHQFENDAFLNTLQNRCGGDKIFGIDMRRQMPYYHLYDEYVARKISEGRKPSYFNDYKYYSIGFLTRGCVRHCPFCVNKLENEVYRYSELDWFLDHERDSKGKLVRPYIYLWDDNFLASDKSIWKPMLEELIASKRPFQFRQGLDERILGESADGPLIAEMLSKCKYHGDFIFAFDNWKDRPKIEKALKIWKKYCPKKSTKFYLFCGYELDSGNDEKLYQDVKELFERIKILMQYGCFGYVMRHDDYKNHELSNIYVQIARWCNQPQFYRYMSFWEYCYRNQSFWEQRTKKLNVPNQISFAAFERRLKTGYYEKHNLKLCKTLQTLMSFLSNYPEHRGELLEMINYKLKELTNPNLWEEEI